MDALQQAVQSDIFTPLFVAKCLIVAGLICFAIME